jgi:hypothetical protein
MLRCEPGRLKLDLVSAGSAQTISRQQAVETAIG